MLFIKRRTLNKEHGDLVNCIRNDLKAILEKKGIDVSNINIDINSKNVNIQVYVGQRLTRT